jgi:hypothetical protein
MDGRRLRALLDDVTRRWPRLGVHARVAAASALIVGGLVVPGLVGGSWPGRESEAGAVVTEAAPLLAVAAPAVPSVAAPVPTAVPPTTVPATTVPPAVVTTTTYPWVLEIDPATVTSTTQFALPPGAVLTTAQAKDLIRSKFPRSEWDNALAVAECESHFQALAVNVNTNRTRDLGLFQINDGGTLQELGGTEALAFDPVWNVDAAYRLWRSYGWIRWTCAFRVGILDPDLTSTSGSSTSTTATTRPPTRVSSPTTFNWPLTTSTTAPPTTAAPASTVAPTTAATAPTTAAPTTSAPTTSATTPTSGPPTT